MQILALGSGAISLGITLWSFSFFVYTTNMCTENIGMNFLYLSDMFRIVCTIFLCIGAFLSVDKRGRGRLLFRGVVVLLGLACLVLGVVAYTESNDYNCLHFAVGSEWTNQLKNVFSTVPGCQDIDNSILNPNNMYNPKKWCDEDISTTCAKQQVSISKCLRYNAPDFVVITKYAFPLDVIGDSFRIASAMLFFLVSFTGKKKGGKKRTDPSRRGSATGEETTSLLPGSPNKLRHRAIGDHTRDIHLDF